MEQMKMDAVTMEVETVTPEMAGRYLKRNVDNYRKISKAKVQLYAGAMKAGKWQMNGEGIMFDSEGKLKNGQHRLAAVILAGVPVQMTVIRGISTDVTIYDVGQTRSTMQIANASGCDDLKKEEASVGAAIVGRFATTDKGRIIDWLLKHRGDLARAYRVAGAQSKGFGRRTASVLAAYLMMRTGMPAYEAETFFRVFGSGNNVGADGYEPSPALVARRMFEDRFKGSGGRLVKEQTEILVLALTDFHKAKSRQLNYKVTEPMKCMEMLDLIRKEDGIA